MRTRKSKVQILKAFEIENLELSKLTKLNLIHQVVLGLVVRRAPFQPQGWGFNPH